MLKLDAQVPSISFYLERHIFEVHTAIIKFLSTDKIFATLLFSIYKLCYSNWNLLFIVRTWCFRNIFGIQLDYLQIENNTFLCFLLVNQKKKTQNMKYYTQQKPSWHKRHFVDILALDIPIIWAFSCQVWQIQWLSQSDRWHLTLVVIYADYDLCS